MTIYSLDILPSRFGNSPVLLLPDLHTDFSGGKSGGLVFPSLRIFHSLWWSTQSNGEGNGTPLQYSCLENPMDEGAWWAAVHGVAKSWTRLRDFPFTFHFHALENEMATHSSVLAWRIPGMREPGGLLSMGSHRIGHDWSDLAAATAAHSQRLYYSQ